MNIAKKFGSLAHAHLIKQGMIETLLEQGFSSLQDWRFQYELEGGPEVRKAKKSEHPWRPWAEAMLKWACTPPFRSNFGSFVMRDYCRAPLMDTFSLVNEKNWKGSWERFSQEIPSFLMTDDFILSLSGHIRPRELPVEFQTAELINQLAKKNFQYVEDYGHLITEKTAVEICAREGNRFDQLPDRLKTDSALDSAMTNCSWMLDRASEQQQTPERCEVNVKLHKTLYGVPEHLITQEMCDIAISYSLDAVEYAPSSMLNESNLFNGAVANPSKAQKHVPKEFFTQDFVERLVKANYKALWDLSDSLVSDELIKQAIRWNVLSIRSVKSHRITDEIADLLVECDPQAFPMLGDRFKTPQRALKIAEKYPFALTMVRVDEVSDDDLLKAVNADYKLMFMLPRERVTYEMNLSAISQNGDLLRMVDEGARSEEICLMALGNSDQALPHIPDQYLKRSAFVEKAVRANPGLAGKLGQGMGMAP